MINLSNESIVIHRDFVARAVRLDPRLQLGFLDIIIPQNNNSEPDGVCYLDNNQSIELKFALIPSTVKNVNC